MKLRSTGRWIALASVAAVVFAACSSGSGSSAVAPSAAAPSAAGSLTIGYLPKDIVNQYFAAAKTGLDKAAS